MSENVLYVKSDEVMDHDNEEESESIEDDIWDDTALVKAYDKAILMAKEKMSKDIGSMNGEEEASVSKSPGKKTIAKEAVNGTVSKRNEKKEKSRKHNQWKVGMFCRTIYTGDGLEYEAVIRSFSTSRNCVVKYLGYDNEEEVPIESLKQSHGAEARINQQMQSKRETCQDQAIIFPHQNEQRQQEIMGMIPPPPPPFLMANLPKDETDALSAMLMSWYMSGYHTGYYQGLIRSKTSRNFK